MFQYLPTRFFPCYGNLGFGTYLHGRVCIFFVTGISKNDSSRQFRSVMDGRLYVNILAFSMVYSNGVTDGSQNCRLLMSLGVRSRNK